MNVSKVLLSAGIVGAITIAGLTTTAFAWHPQGVITKKVQNVTTNSALSEADTVAQAVAAKPGDTLKYVIEVSNNGAADSKGYNDMAKTVMTDTLPAGVELVSNPSKRMITENIGTVKPGQKVTKEYLVKVVSKTNGSIQNTACFTGDSTANDNPQKGCNPAVVTITVPPVVTPPVVTPPVVTPPATTTPVVEVPAELPHTGASENILLGSIALGAMAYAAYRFVESKRSLSSARTQI
ncbi:MAG: hypothetical protein JWP06_567 [Candidatus Saccharibacteria bacterium]|nr:hypothetical protein [Candidatus Saccharibacteria bacterium]